MKKINFLIPFRSGSKGLKDKNLRELCRMPLYMHTVQHALSFKCTDSRVIISTDYAEENLRLPADSKITFLARPSKFADDASNMDDVIYDAINSGQISGIVVLLQVTSPLRSVADIEAALNKFLTNKYNLVISVTEADNAVLKYGFYEDGKFLPLNESKYCFENRQSLPKVYRPNGAIYIFDTCWYLLNKCLRTDKIGCVLMPAERSVDIDNEIDFHESEEIMKYKDNYENC